MGSRTCRARWWAATLTGQDWLAFPTAVLTVAGPLGPLVVPAALLARGYGGEPPEVFPRRCFDPRTLPLRWDAGVATLLVVFAVVPALLARGAAGLAPAVTGPAVFLLVGLVAGGIEEPAWRGYARGADLHRARARGGRRPGAGHPRAGAG